MNEKLFEKLRKKMLESLNSLVNNKSLKNQWAEWAQGQTMSYYLKAGYNNQQALAKTLQMTQSANQIVQNKEKKNEKLQEL
jgi:hypothetical protein